MFILHLMVKTTPTPIPYVFLNLSTGFSGADFKLGFILLDFSACNVDIQMWSSNWSTCC